jgi:hypothetical protein
LKVCIAHKLVSLEVSSMQEAFLPSANTSIIPMKFISQTHRVRHLPHFLVQGKAREFLAIQSLSCRFNQRDM